MPQPQERTSLSRYSIGKSLGEIRSRVSPGLQNILGNTGWLMLDRVIRMGLGVVVGVWVARYLGPSQFGSLNFAISFVALFGTLTTLGLENIVIKEIVLDGSRLPELLGTAFALRLGGSLLAPLLAVAAVFAVQPHDSLAILLVSLLSIGLVFQAFDTIDSYFQSQVRSRLTVWAKNSAFLTVAALRINLIHRKGPVWSFAAAQVVELALGAIGMVVLYRWSGGRIKQSRFSRSRAVELLKLSWPVILSGMAIMIYMRIDMVMLKVMKGDVAVGIYAAATRVSEVWYFIPSAIVSSVAPAIIRAKNNPTVYHTRLQKLFSVMTLLAVIIGSGIALSSHWIIHRLYSQAFDAASPVLAVHVWASVFVFLGVAQAPWDFSENLLKLGFYRTLSGAVSNVFLNVFLIPRYGALGAAIATVVSYAVSGVLANAFNSATRPILVMQMRSLFLMGLWSKATEAE
jgi:polysaccharide transporter, PST family